MQYVTLVERIAKEEGFQEGYQRGLQERRREGISSLFGVLLALRFGQLPEWATAKLQSASEETILAWAENFFEAQSLEEIFI